MTTANASARASVIENKPDILVQNEGSIFLLRPVSQAAKDWVNQNIGPDNGYQPYWPTVVIEPRYVETVIDGMQADGLVIR